MTDKLHVKRLFVLCIVLFGGSIASQLTNDHEFLPVDEAYPTEAQLSEDGRVLARWVMPDGYYLYKHALKIVGKEGTELGSLVIPTGKQKTDEFFGEVEVYYNFLEISVPVLGQSHANVVVDVHSKAVLTRVCATRQRYANFDLRNEELTLAVSPHRTFPLTRESIAG